MFVFFALCLQSSSYQLCLVLVAVQTALDLVLIRGQIVVAFCGFAGAPRAIDGVLGRRRPVDFRSLRDPDARGVDPSRRNCRVVRRAALLAAFLPILPLRRRLVLLLVVFILVVLLLLGLKTLGHCIDFIQLKLGFTI